jgi:peptidoglycan/LPS O-acetylase OafA/YrhL
MLVIFFHLDYPLIQGGFIGVDVFFVISGFLITKSIIKEVETTGTFSMLGFYARRIRRLAPSIVSSVGLTLFVGCLTLSPSILYSTSAEVITSFLSISNIYFWQTSNYFDPAAKLKPLLHTWSLSVEEQFYVAWPVLFLALYRNFRFLSVVGALVGLLGLSLIANLVFGVAEVKTGIVSEGGAWRGASTIFYLLPFRAFELLIGALGALLPSSFGSMHRVAFPASVLGFASIMLSGLVYDGTLLYPSLPALVPCVGSLLLIMFGDKSRVFQVAFGNRAMSAVGRISYSLYLFHWPVIVLYGYVFGKLTSVDNLLLLAIMFALSLSNFTWIEEPFRRQRRSILWIVPVAILIVTVALHIRTNRGWPWRVPLGDVARQVDYHRKEYGGAGYSLTLSQQTSDSDFLLVGDSHGLQYAEGISRVLAEPLELKIAAVAGTSLLHLPGLIRRGSEYEWEKLRDRVLLTIRDRLNSSSVQPVVVMSHSWIFQMNRAMRTPSASRADSENVTVADLVDAVKQFKLQFDIRELLVIGEVPGTQIGNSLFDELTKPWLSRRWSIQSLAYVPLRQDIKEFNRALAEEARRSGNFVFMDPTDVLCKEGVCRNLDEHGQLIYSDSAHLSKVGSVLVIRGFKGQLEQAVLRTRPSGDSRGQ